MSETIHRLQPLQIHNRVGSVHIEHWCHNKKRTKQSGLRSGAKHRAQDAPSYSDEVQKHLKRYVKRLDAAFGRTRNLRHYVTSKWSRPKGRTDPENRWPKGPASPRYLKKAHVCVCLVTLNLK